MTEVIGARTIKENGFNDRGLLQYFDRKLMEQFQQALVKATGLAFITVDYRGIPVTECTNFCEHCQRIRDDVKGRESCHASDAYGAIQAAVSEKPHIYFCSHGMIEMAVPIVVNGQYMGGFIGGQIRCDDAPSNVSRLDKLQPISETAEEYRQRMEVFKKVPLMPYKQIVNVANLVSLIINQLCVRALESLPSDSSVAVNTATSSDVPLTKEQQLIVDTLSSLIMAGNYREIHKCFMNLMKRLVSSGQDISELIQFGYKLLDALSISSDVVQCKVTDVRSGISWIYQIVEIGLQHRCTIAYPLMKNVFIYLEEHINEDISLKDVVSHCDISQGYLSRILKKYYGISVMEYIHFRKLFSAKLALIFTNESIASIAQRCGYASSSYFSKIFKKYEDETCREYRQVNQYK